MSGIIGNVGSKSGVIPPLFLKSGTLNSKGFMKHLFFGGSYYFNYPNNNSIDDGSWSEVDPGSDWTKMPSTGVSGSDDADIWGNMNGSTSRWTANVSGYYLVSYFLYHGGGFPSAGSRMMCVCRRNGSSSPGGNLVGNFSQQVGGGVASQGGSGSGIFQLDTDDYISLWAYHDSSNAEATNHEYGQLSIYYVGSSDL